MDTLFFKVCVGPARQMDPQRGSAEQAQPNAFEKAARWFDDDGFIPSTQGDRESSSSDKPGPALAARAAVSRGGPLNRNDE